MSNLNNNTTQLEALLAKVNALPEAGGADTSDATATAEDILSGKTAYINGEKVTGAMDTVPQATPELSITDAGKIVATTTQSKGFVEAGIQENSLQLLTQSATTITPNGTTQIAVSKNTYVTDDIVVNAIPSEYIIPQGTKTITTDGVHDVAYYAFVQIDIDNESSSPDTPSVDDEDYHSVGTAMIRVSNADATAMFHTYSNAYKSLDIHIEPPAPMNMGSTIQYRYMLYDLLVGSAIVVFNGGTVNAMNGCEVLQTTDTYTILKVVEVK